ncbi:C4-dicarboxylate ABC transporter [Planobispora takensis]|uniref:C4-dicarboxylate ABC transporter n=2 Tax=Planobispora takensis TaxID=1367882 RepID=A0A8J3WVL2_9ACTN|nr:C4-dicarboxylate ABC transporter [Planobispora takensis]
MGTGILATALPPDLDALRPLAAAVWLLAGLMLVALAFTWRHRRFDPEIAPFLGAPPMALLTVGTGTLLYGQDLIGLRAAVAVDAALWLAGTLLGLASLIGVPWFMLTRHRPGLHEASGLWLMPVVPPMVAATSGAYLVPHAGSLGRALLVACYALFGLSLLAVVPIVVVLVRRIRVHGPGAASTVPTLVIVLGPLGQSVTAVNQLARSAPELAGFGLWYGVPVWTAAMAWLLVAAFFLLRTVRRGGLPYALTWWSFTFPVGTCVTGASALAVQLGSELFGWAALGLYGLLAGAWVTVALRTVPLVAPQVRELAIRPGRSPDHAGSPGAAGPSRDRVPAREVLVLAVAWDRRERQAA